MNPLEKLQYRFKNAGIVEKLIYINLAVFIFVFVFNTLLYLFNSHDNFIIKWFALPASFSDFIMKPWSIISYGFLHANFLHILVNLIALYFIGHLFIQFFTTKQLLNFYLLGTVIGGILFLLAYNYLPALKGQNTPLVGASAGISAIFIGIATYMPNYELKIRLIGFVKLWVLGAIWVVLDIIQIPAGNAGGHIAHLGGALFGFLYIKSFNNSNIDIFKSLKSFFKKKKKTNMKTVHKSTNFSRKQAPKNENQEKIDRILDKISKSGYDALSKDEKDFLFKQGKQ